MSWRNRQHSEAACAASMALTLQTLKVEKKFVDVIAPSHRTAVGALDKRLEPATANGQ